MAQTMDDRVRADGYSDEARRLEDELRGLHKRLADLYLEGLDAQVEVTDGASYGRLFCITRHVGTAQRALSVALDCLADMPR